MNLRDNEMERLYVSQCSNVEWCKGYNVCVEKANVRINILQAEIGELIAFANQLEEQRNLWMEKCDDVQAENERLKEEIELLHSDYTYKLVKKKAKAEAYKEFATNIEKAFSKTEIQMPNNEVIKQTVQICRNSIQMALKELVVRINDTM